MKAIYTSIVVLLGSLTIFSASTSSAGIFDKVPSKSGNYCKDDVMDFFNHRFAGAKVETLEKIGGGLEWAIWMTTDICPGGHFVFEFRGIEGYQCTMAQYGKRTHFLRSVWASGTCQELMPYPQHP